MLLEYMGITETLPSCIKQQTTDFFCWPPSLWTGQSDYQLFIRQFSLEIRRSPMRLPSRRKAAFFDDFINKSGSLKALFYAISRLLYTVGREPYIENGIDWMYKTGHAWSWLPVTALSANLVYMEEYVGLFCITPSHGFQERCGTGYEDSDGAGVYGKSGDRRLLFSCGSDLK